MSPIRLIDISVPLSPALPVWPGSPRVKIEQRLRIADGADANASVASFDVHSGTHIDAPRHFFDQGGSVGSIPLDVLVGRARVCSMVGHHRITRELLDAADIPRGTERLLIKTSSAELWTNGAGEFEPDFCAITADAAEWIVDRRIRLVGIDYMSIQLYDDGPETHQTLLGAGIVILEGLDLTAAPPGEYELVCLPLRLDDAEAAPARAVLRPIPEWSAS